MSRKQVKKGSSGPRAGMPGQTIVDTTSQAAAAVEAGTSIMVSNLLILLIRRRRGRDGR